MLIIATVQFAPVLADLDATLERLAAVLDQAAAADLVILPELSNSGYAFASRDQAWNCAEGVADSRFVDFLRDRCSHHDFDIISGFAERDGAELYNTAILVGSEGCSARYRKLHLFGNEPDWCQPGNLGLPICERRGLRIGMLLCFDWAFPEVWRILALRGADLIAHPCNLVLPGLGQRAASGHALVNRTYVATSNRTGTEGDLRFTGLSQIAGPDGKLIAAAPQTGDAVLIADCEVGRARDKQITAHNHLLDDRRPECYGDLIKPTATPDTL